MTQDQLVERVSQMDDVSLAALREIAERYHRAKAEADNRESLGLTPLFHQGRAEAHLQGVALLLGCKVAEVRRMLARTPELTGSPT